MFVTARVFWRPEIVVYSDTDDGWYDVPGQMLRPLYAQVRLNRESLSPPHMPQMIEAETQAVAADLAHFIASDHVDRAPGLESEEE